jgi:hypothetical protein
MTRYMAIWLKAAVVAIAIVSAVAWPSVGEASPREKNASSPEELEDPARRVGYVAPEGARRLGRAYPSQSGDQVAFFEERGDAVQLVVAVKGGATARWPVSPDTARLSVYWVGPSEIILGTDVLAPKMRVKWYVARAG